MNIWTIGPVKKHNSIYTEKKPPLQIDAPFLVSRTISGLILPPPCRGYLHQTV